MFNVASSMKSSGMNGLSQNSLRKENIVLFRVISCLMVFICHLCQKMSLPANILQITQFGRFGVEIFFIISGYLIATSYYSYGKKNRKLYIGRKMVRILPLYYSIILYFFLTDTFLFKYEICDTSGFGWIRYIFILNGILPYPSDGYWWNLGMSWTIPMFMCAYFFFPICLRMFDAISKKGLTWGGILFVFIAIMELLNVIQIRYFPGCFIVLRYLRFFSLGMVLYYAERDEKVVHIAVIASLYELYILIIGKQDEEMLYALFFLVLLIITRDIKIKSITIKRIISVMDKYSFTIYMVQSIPLSQFIREYEARNSTMMPPQYVAIVVFVSTICFALLFFHYVQQPFERLFNSSYLNNEIKSSMRGQGR